MITKQAAEQQAQEFYSLGQQLALEEAGLIKEASLGKRLRQLLGGAGAVGGVAMSPAAYEALGANLPTRLGQMMPSSAIGSSQLNALEELLAGKGLQGAKKHLGHLSTDAQIDKERLIEALQGAGSSAKGYLTSLMN